MGFPGKADGAHVDAGQVGEGRAASAAAESERVAVRLKVEIKAAERRLGELSEELGKHPGYLGKVLGAPDKLKVKTVFGVLAALGLPPADFFLRLRPHGESGTFSDLRSLAEVAARRPPGSGAEGEPAGGGEVARLSRQLQLKIIEAGRSLRDVSQAMGLPSEDHLGVLLRGRVDLKVWHVYAALAAVEVPAADFFDELYGLVRGAPNLTLPGGYTWSELISLVESLNARLDADRGDAADEGEAEPATKRGKSGA